MPGQADRPTCHVTVRDAAGKPWTMTVHARSMHEAVFAYSTQQVCGQADKREYPPILHETEVEVTAPDGRVLKTTGKRAWDWANAKAERQNQRPSR